MDKQLIEIQQELMKYFPDNFYRDQKEIRRLHVAKMINNYIYKQNTYNEKYKEKRLTFGQVLKKLGLKKRDYYDVKTMLEIHEQFDVTYERWGEFFGGIKRQAPEQTMTDNDVRDYYQWSETNLTDADIQFILGEMVQKNKYLAVNEAADRTYFLINNITKAEHMGDMRLLLLSRDGETVTGQVYLNKIENSRLEEPLRQAGYYDIPLYEMGAYQSFLALLKDRSKHQQYLTREENEELKRWVNKSAFEDVEDLLDKYGSSSEILYATFRKNSYDNRTMNRFEKYADEDRVVIIPHTLEDGRQNGDLTSLHRIAKDKGFDSIEELAASYGYTYISNETLRSVKSENLYQDGLDKRTIRNNVIYIHSMDPFYRLTRGRSSNEGYSTIDEYLSENYNLLRIYQEDLKESDHLYKWTNELDESLLDADELYEYLTQFVHADGMIDEKSLRKWYRRVYYHAYHYNQSVPAILRSFGLKYTEQSINYEEVSETEELLNDLEQLNHELAKSTTTVEKYKRNRELVKLLKRLYHHQCQCCGADESFPPIMTNKQVPYVEVHHIRPLASKDNIEWAQAGNDESSIILDHYKNCLVVCPYHHKKIHFEQNGYFNFDRKNLRIYNESNDFIPIYQDLHLKD